MASNLVRSAVIVMALGLCTAACSTPGANAPQGGAPTLPPTTAPAGGAAAATSTLAPTATTAAGGPAAATPTLAPLASATTMEAVTPQASAAVTGTSTVATTAPAVTATMALTGTATAAATAAATTAPVASATMALTGTATIAPAGTAAAGATVSPALVQTGQGLYQSLGCIGCHSVDGSQKVGPTFKGLFGSQVKLTNGQTVTADEAYIRQSILQSNSQIVQGFQPNIMPSFAQLSDQQVQALVAYIASVR